MNALIRVLIVAVTGGFCAGCSSVTIMSRPDNAEVFNGCDLSLGQTPVYLGSIYTSMTLKVRKEGYLPSTVSVGPMSPSLVRVELVEEPSASRISKVEPVVKPDEPRRATPQPEKKTVALPLEIPPHRARLNMTNCDAIVVELNKLRELKDTGALSQQAFETRRKALLDQH